MLIEELLGGDGGKHGAKAYWNALAKLRMAWKEAVGEDLPTVGNRAKDAFDQALDQVRSRIKNDLASAAKVRTALDVDAQDDIEEVLLGHADLDDIPPKVVKEALLGQCLALGAGRHELRALLRPALDQIFSDTVTRRPRVGANRHWPRLLQYVRELEEETTWGTGKGLHLVNAGGRGRVAQHPDDPARLAVKIDLEHL